MTERNYTFNPPKNVTFLLKNGHSSNFLADEVKMSEDGKHYTATLQGNFAGQVLVDEVVSWQPYDDDGADPGLISHQF